MKQKLMVLGTVLLLVFISSTAFSGVPEVISYQGILTDTAGSPLNGNYNITVNIYNVSSGGASLWGETHSNVPVDNGVFNVMLGKVNPFGSVLDFSVPYWLGISVNGGSEFTPRMELASVGTALMCKTVMDNSITSGKILSGQVVKSLNGLKDNVTITAGSNVSVAYPGGNQIQISASVPPSITCNWSGWRKSAPDLSCGGDGCKYYKPAFQAYCSGGIITQMSAINVCIECNSGD